MINKSYCILPFDKRKNIFYCDFSLFFMMILSWLISLHLVGVGLSISSVSWSRDGVNQLWLGQFALGNTHRYLLQTCWHLQFGLFSSFRWLRRYCSMKVLHRCSLSWGQLLGCYLSRCMSEQPQIHIVFVYMFVFNRDLSRAQCLFLGGAVRYRCIYRGLISARLAVGLLRRNCPLIWYICWVFPPGP